ncbi:MAG TPA: M56 family metallopeptidase, partial [Pirellulales bacterium]
ARAAERFRRRPSTQWSYVLHVSALLLGLALVVPTFVLVGADSGTVAISSPPVRESANDHRVTPASTDSPREMGDAKALFSATASRYATVDTASPPHWQRAAVWFFASYLFGVAWMLARLGAALFSASRLARRATLVADGPLPAIVQAFVREWSMRVTPLLAETNRIATPQVVGLLRPVVLLPASALSGLSCDELEMVLAHELAHIRRHDLWIVLVQRLTEALLFFNPALWYLTRRVSMLREYCCDDVVCGSQPPGASQLRYAELLLKLVALAAPELGRETGLAALAAAGRSPSELRRRVARLLGEPQSEPLRLTRGSILAVALVGLLLVLLPRMAPSQTPQGDVPKPPDTAVNDRFSFGGRVEVLALGTHDQEDDRWWDARGRALKALPAPLTGCMVPRADEQGHPLASLPIAWKKATDTVFAEGVVWRRIVLQIHNLPEDAVVQWQVEESHASGGGEVSVHGQRNPQGYVTRYFGVPRDEKKISVEVGVAAGKWKKVAEVQPSGSTAIGQLSHGIVFSEEFDTPQGASVFVSHDYFDQDCRVVAIDKQGKSHDTFNHGRASANRICQTRVTFLKLKRDDIDHFEFQTRDYEYVVLRGIPIQPPEQR